MGVNHHLDRDPFPRGSPDGYFFTTPALSLRLDLLREYITRGDSPVLLVGEAGSGKTTLVHQLVTRADSSWRIVRIPAVASFSAEEFATLIGEQLGLSPHNSDSSLFEGLGRWLLRLTTRGQLALVVVDDADQLGDEGLRFLAELTRSTRATNLRLLLAGKTTLPGRIRSAMGRARARNHLHIINIPSFDQHEVARYIDMRLYHAGMEGGHRFSRSIVDDIARDSHGRPGRINAIAGRLLSARDGENRWRRAVVLMRRLGRRLARPWIPATVLALGVAAAVTPDVDGPTVTTQISAPAPVEPTIAHPGAVAAGRSCPSAPGAGAPCRRSDAALGRLLFSLAVLPRLWQGSR